MLGSLVPFIVMNCKNACGSSTRSAQFGNSSKAESPLTFPTYQAPSLPTQAPGDLSQIKDGKVNKSKPCQTLWLTHQKFPQQCSTHCFPSLPTNLVESKGSPLIHASERHGLVNLWLKRSMPRCPATSSLPPSTPEVKQKRRKQDIFVVTASCAWYSLSNVLSLLGLVVDHSFIPHPPIANTKQTFNSF